MLHIVFQGNGYYTEYLCAESSFAKFSYAGCHYDKKCCYAVCSYSGCHYPKCGFSGGHYVGVPLS